MKIPIQYITDIGGRRSLDKHTRLFFKYLQNDRAFLSLIRKVRVRLDITVPDPEGLAGELEISTKTRRQLRSEMYIVKSDWSEGMNPDVVRKLDTETERILRVYPFMRDWRAGLRHFICGDKFILVDSTNPIQIRVKNRLRPYIGKYTDRNTEEGVKIVMRHQVSKIELKRWIDINYSLIKNFLRTLPNRSNEKSVRVNYERDRLVVYLHRIWEMSYRQIADVLMNELSEECSEKSLQKASDDFLQ